MANPRSDLAPETVNDEQIDKDEQAQTVADQARGRSPSSYGLDEDSEKAVGSVTEDDDTEDLVDHMKQMDRGGIDMSAYDGEPNMDDNEQKYGHRNIMEDEPRNSDS
jgi:hypothetical protein